MKIMRLLPGICLVPWLFIGCKSAQPIAFSPGPERADLSGCTQRCPISTTNVYYKFERGPGCAGFILASDYDAMGLSGGTKVVVVDGHFPPAADTLEPANATTALSPNLPYPRQDISLIGDSDAK